MIIDKVAESWTEEEKHRLKELELERTNILSNTRGLTDDEFSEALDKAGKVIDTINSLYDSVTQRYIKTRGVNGLLEDIRETVTNLTAEDFLAYIAYNKETYAKVELVQTKANLPYDDGMKAIKNMTIEGYENCYSFIIRQVRTQLQAIIDIGGDVGQATAIIEKQIEVLGYGKPHYVRQGPAINNLIKVKPRKHDAVDMIDRYGKATVQRGDFTLTITEYADVKGYRPSTYQLLDAIDEAFTQTGAKSPIIMMELSSYMEQRGLRDRKEARKQIKEDIDTIYNSSIKFFDPIFKTTFDTRIIETKPEDGITRGGYIFIKFADTFYNILLGYPVMYLPQELYQINGKQNPNSYFLGKKIALHKNMNAGKKNEDIIAVKTLLASAPDIPAYKDVMETGRQVKQRIIDPFERDMDALEKMITWEYCHSKGEPLTQAELDQMDYNTFIALMVKIHWHNYPDQTARLQKKAERIEKAKTAKKKAIKKKA